MRIRSWTTATGGCGEYRLRIPFAELARHGHQTIIPTEARLVPSVEDVLAADVMVGQRIAAEPVLPEWKHRRAHTPVVYELDDDIWSIDVANPALSSYLNPQVGDAAERFIARSDLVTVSTAPLAEKVSQWNRNVVVLPNRIDAAVLDLPRPERRDRVVVGWTASTSHTTDLHSVAHEWREFFRGRPDVELHIVGADYRPMLELPGVRHTGWTNDLMAYYGGIDFDIGLAPLAPIEFNLGKTALKALEYGARGIPTVASDFGPYRDFVEDGVTGFLVREPEEWGKRIGELVDDPAMRAEMGANARAVAERWTVQEHWRDWERAYASVLR